MSYEIIGTFVGGVATGLVAAWGYWKTIPLPKKKAALESLAQDAKDGKLTASELMTAVGKLF